jgi:ABC-type polar amino acid transport system ATPase subunit
VISESGIGPVAVRRKLGMVFQQFDLFDHLDVLATARALLLDEITSALDPDQVLTDPQTPEAQRFLMRVLRAW